jgi:hypothetical protein
MVCGKFVSIKKRSSLLLYFFGLIKATPEARGLSPTASNESPPCQAVSAFG